MSDHYKEALKTLSVIAESLKNIENSAQSVAQASIVGVVYRNDDLQKLFSEYRSLYDAWNEAHNCVKTAYDVLREKFGDSSSLGFLKQKFGDEEAYSLYEGVTKAEELRKEATKAYDAFCKKHPLVHALYTSALKKHHE